MIDHKNTPPEGEENVLDRQNDRTIHSGHFMVSFVHDEKEDDETPPPVKEEPKQRGQAAGYDFQKATMEVSKYYNFDHKSTASLTTLFECMSLAYSGKLTSPKWKTFKGLKLKQKEKIRLNNIIWREWFMQYIQARKPIICQFAASICDETHTKPEAVVLEGKYWKRRLESVTAEYKKWRLYFKDKITATPQTRQFMETSELLDRVSQQDAFSLVQPNPPTWTQMLQQEDEFEMDFTDTLFSTLNQPFAFPNPKEMSQLGNADIIQPGLVQLQPNLDDFMDTLEPLQENNWPPNGGIPVSNYANRYEPAVNDLLSCKPFLPSSTASSVPQSLSPMPMQTDTPQLDQKLLLNDIDLLGGTDLGQGARMTMPTGVVRSMSQPTLQDMPEPPTPPPLIVTPSVQEITTQVVASVQSSAAPVIAPAVQTIVTSVPPKQLIQPAILNVTTPIRGTSQAQLLSNSNQMNLLLSSLGCKTSTPAQVAAPVSAQLVQGIQTPTLQAGQPIQTIQVIPAGNLQGILINQSAAGQTNTPILGSLVSQGTLAIAPNVGSPVFSLAKSSTSPASLVMNFVNSDEKRRASTGSIAQQTQIKASGKVKDGEFVVPKHPPKPGPSKPKHRNIVPATANPLATNKSNNTFLAQLLTTGTYPGANIALKPEPTITLTPQTTTASFTPVRSAPAQSVASSSSVTFTVSSSMPVTDFQKNIILAAASQARATVPVTPTVPDSVISPASSPSPSLGSPSPESPLIQVPSPASLDLTTPPKPFRPKTDSERLIYQERRRACHITAEQKRRCNIKSGFDTLHSMVPALSQNPNAKISKATTLQKTAEFCKKLKEERAQMLEEAAGLKKEIESLYSAINVCQSQLPATGVPVTRQRVDQMRDMLDEYISSRTRQNWKFWVFSVIIRPLFDSYNSMVSTGSMDDLCRTVLAWLDQHCSLVSLRPAVLNSLTYLCTKTSILSDPSRVPEQAVQAVAQQNHSDTSPGLNQTSGNS